jgi:hypothetical protein
MYVSHTAGHLVLAQGGRFETDFRKRDEEKCSDAAS